MTWVGSTYESLIGDFINVQLQLLTLHAVCRGKPGQMFLNVALCNISDTCTYGILTRLFLRHLHSKTSNATIVNRISEEHH